MDVIYQPRKMNAFKHLPVCTIFRHNNDIYIKVHETSIESEDKNWVYNVLCLTRNTRHYFETGVIVEIISAKLIVYGEPPKESEE